MQTTHQETLHAFKWSALGEATSKVIAPLIILVLARLLLPVDFGVVAAATVIISFSQVFSEAGLAKALIQRQDRTEESANVVFWANLGLGIFMVGALSIAAPLIADFFHDQRITPVIRVLSLQLLLAAFSSVHTALLQKELNFKHLFWVRLLTTGIPALASIPLALAGFGYWALVAGSLGGQIAQSVALWMSSDWRPRLGLDFCLGRDLVGFGKWAMLSGLLGWFYLWMDAVVVGHYLGAHEMGLYRTGNTFVSMLFGLMFAPLLPVLYTLFSRAQHDLTEVKHALLVVIRGTALFASPMAAILILLCTPIEQVLFGSKWAGLGPIIAILAIAHGMSWLVGAYGEAYRAIGKPHLETWALGLSAVAYLIGYLLSVRHGLIVFAVTRCGLVLIGLLAHVAIAKRALGVSPSNWISNAFKPFLVVATALLFFAYISYTLVAGLLGTSVALLLTLATYSLYVLFYERVFLAELLKGTTDAA